MKTNFTQRKFYIVYFLLVIAIFFSRKSFATVYTDNGTSTSYNLLAGDSLAVLSGTYTGNINKFLAGSKLYVAPGANFTPGQFKNPAGTFTNYGTASLSSAVPINAGFTLNNYGLLTFNGTVSITGTSTLINSKAGTIDFKAVFTLSNGSVLQNDGIMIFEQNFNTIVPSIVTNNNTIKTFFNFNVDDLFLNNGLINSYNKFNVNSNAKFTNNCRVLAGGGLTNLSDNTINNGLVWMTDMTGTSDLLQNSAKWTNTSNGRIRTPKFNNDSAFTGGGHIYITGASKNAGKMGINGDPVQIVVYDVTRTNLSTIFDIQTIIPENNVVYQSFSAPDTTDFTGCAATFITQNSKSLPIVMSYFGAFVEDNSKVKLNWVTEMEMDNEYYSVERSQDGKNFTAIAMVLGSLNSSIRKTYEYKDDLKGADASKTIYYRIKQIDLDGHSTYSPVRSVKLSQKQNMIQVNPNPFVDNITVKYMSPSSGKMDIRIINTNGQMVVNKTNGLVKGFNNVAIYNLGSLARGLYIVEVMINGEVSEKTKLMKN